MNDSADLEKDLEAAEIMHEGHIRNGHDVKYGCGICSMLTRKRLTGLEKTE